MATAPGKQASATTGPVETRRYKRYRLTVPVSVCGSDASIIPGMTLEISEAGLSAVLASPLEIGARVKIYPVAGETLAAQVRRKVGKIYGFEFLKVTDEQILRIRQVSSRLPRYPEENGIGI